MPAATVVGLDVGSTSIRAVEATLSKDRPVVHQFGQTALPPGAVVGGVVKDERAVTSALRQLWSAHDFGTKNVALGVTHQQVIVRETDLQNLPLKELRQALPFLVRDILPMPVEHALLDFHPLTLPDKSSDTIHGLLVAAPREAVIDTVRAIEHAGLHVTSVDLSCFAALRAAAHLAGDTEALIDLGANGTNVVFHTDGMPTIVRTVPRGGSEITKLLMTRLDVEMSEAETVKRRVGVNADEHEEAAETVVQALRPLITELRNSFNYFAQVNTAQRIRRLALVGGAALLPGLPAVLTRELGVPAFLADPLQRVSHAHKGVDNDVLGRFRSSAAVSIGLTLGAA